MKCYEVLDSRFWEGPQTDTVFPHISAPGAYLKTDSKGAAIIGGRR